MASSKRWMSLPEKSYTVSRAFGIIGNPITYTYKGKQCVAYCRALEDGRRSVSQRV